MPASEGGRLERAFLMLVLGLALAAWAAVLLAELGGLSAAFFAVAAVIAATLAFVCLRRGDTTPGGWRNAAAVAVVVFCAAVFFPPYETFVWASDSTVYLGLGAEIARNDGFAFSDPLLAEIEMPTRAEIFRNRAGLDATGIYARLPGGFAIPDIDEPRVAVGFSPVFPALLAVVNDFAGVRAMPWVAPIFATLAMLSLFLLGARLGGTVAGLGSTALAAASMPQVWFAKFAMPEIVAELFVLAAALALHRALAVDRPLMGGVAGCLLGVAALGKFELLPIVAIAVMVFVGAQLVWKGRAPRRVYLWLGGAFGALVAHAALHYLLLPTHYSLFIRQQISSNYPARALSELGGWRAALLVALAAVVAAILLSRLGGGLRSNLARPRWWGSAMLLAVAAYFSNDANAPNFAGNPVGLWAGVREIVVWLGWYLPWSFGIILALAVVAATVLPRRQHDTAPSTVDASARRETLAFVAVLVLVACMHLYRSPDTDEHIWAMRRFVPVVLPCLALLTATLTTTMLRDLGPRRGPAAAALVLGVLTILVATPSLSIIAQPLWEDGFDESADIAALLPEGAVALVSADLAGTHLATSLNYIHGVPTIVLRPPLSTPALPGELVAGWIEDNRPVFAIIGERVFSFYAPDLSLIEIDHRVLDVPILERTTDRAPRRVVHERAALTVARLITRETAPTLIDIGNLADDTFFQLFGVHGVEADPGQPDRSFRWTIGAARLLIPPSDRVRLTLSGARPDGAPPARVSVSVDGVVVIEDVVISDEPMELLVDIPPRNDPGPPADGRPAATVPPLTEPRLLVLASSTFRPADDGNSRDERQLGVRLYRVQLDDPVARGGER